MVKYVLHSNFVPDRNSKDRCDYLFIYFFLMNNSTIRQPSFYSLRTQNDEGRSSTINIYGLHILFE